VKIEEPLTKEINMKNRSVKVFIYLSKYEEFSLIV